MGSRPGKLVGGGKACGSELSRQAVVRVRRRKMFMREREAEMTLIKDRSFYRQLARIALPLALQNIITVGVS